MEEQKNSISCYKCCHYKVTWDMRQPYGCRAHGFKTHRNPALIVYATSGIECQLFEPKKSSSAGVPS